MRVLRWSFAVLGLVALVLLLVVGGLWTWAGTDGSADWALRQAARRVPGLQAQGVEGSIRHGLRVQRLAWSQDGLQVEATQVELAWQPLALLQRRLQVDRLRAQAVRVDDRRPPSGEPSQPPQTLVLPLAVALDDLHVGRLEVAGRTALQLQDLAAGYGWDGTQHRLDLRNLQLAEGQYSGRVVLAGREPYALEAALHGRVVAPVPGGTATVPLLLDVGATGPLAGFDARLEVRGEPGAAAATNTRALATARVRKWVVLGLCL
jgi:translocation and assembly module TamB